MTKRQEKDIELLTEAALEIERIAESGIETTGEIFFSFNSYDDDDDFGFRIYTVDNYWKNTRNHGVSERYVRCKALTKNEVREIMANVYGAKETAQKTYEFAIFGGKPIFVTFER